MNRQQKLGWCMLVPFAFMIVVIIITVLIYLLLLPLTFWEKDPWITITAYSFMCLFGFFILAFDNGGLYHDK